MRVIKIVDKVVLLLMSILLLMDLYVWSIGSMKYMYICYYLIRWIVVPLAIKTQKYKHKNDQQDRKRNLVEYGDFVPTLAYLPMMQMDSVLLKQETVLSIPTIMPVVNCCGKASEVTPWTSSTIPMAMPMH